MLALAALYVAMVARTCIVTEELFGLGAANINCSKFGLITLTGLWGRQPVLRVRRRLALDQSPEVRAGMDANDDPTNPCKSPYIPDVLVITR